MEPLVELHSATSKVIQYHKKIENCVCRGSRVNFLGFKAFINASTEQEIPVVPKDKKEEKKRLLFYKKKRHTVRHN